MVQGVNLGKLEKYLFYYYCILLLIVSVVTVSQLRILEQYQINAQVIHSKLDYDAFRTLSIHPDLIGAAVDSNKKDYVAYIAYEMLSSQYDLSEANSLKKSSVWKQIEKVENSEVYEELYYYYQMVFADLIYFPVPLQQAGVESVSYVDSWGASRTYGGERLHEGTDLMASNNRRGFFPVISVSDGVVEKKGWLSQGGYRIGIRAPGGAYFYYAHLYNYAPELSEGDEVKAGQLLGFMGDSGYGEEGTIGKFDVHLHFGIYINSKEGEMSVNPYWVLKYLERHKLTFDYAG